jgi:hypothetical protein
MCYQTRPILFNTPMVKQILLGNKTQTRRTKGLESVSKIDERWYFDRQNNHKTPPFTFFDKPYLVPYGKEKKVECPYGKVGDVLWVRETFQNKDYSPTVYKAGFDEDLLRGFEEFKMKWQPSLFMPKSECRLWLKIVNIRVQKLCTITDTDALAEGVEIEFDEDGLYKDYFSNGVTFSPKISFKSLWKSINGEFSWVLDPFVWVIEFERCEMPEFFLK